MVEAFSEAVWTQWFRGGLLAIHDAVAAREKSLPDDERKALRAVADHRAFDGLGLIGDRLARGKWVAQRAVIEEFSPAVDSGLPRDVEEQPVAVGFDVCMAGASDDLEPMAASADVVRLRRDHLSFGLPLGGLELVALALDPRQALHDGQTDVLVVELGRGGHTNPAHWRVDADVQVLDVLVDNVDVYAADREVSATSTHGAFTRLNSLSRRSKSVGRALAMARFTIRSSKGFPIHESGFVRRTTVSMSMASSVIDGRGRPALCARHCSTILRLLSNAATTAVTAAANSAEA